MDTHEEIFAVAKALPEGERAAYLDEACENSEVRERVEELLRGAEGAGEFFAEFDAMTQPGDATSSLGEEPGTVVGRYTLLKKIGEGGMGVVYLAEQHEPVRRRVALKIIKLGMDTREVVARFDAERQALAMMDHPGIARVYDAGATEQGRPYFVMELVEGQPLTEYCDERRLATKARLNLFMEVCGAVQHAHHKGVVHRDLKPSNILVTEQDGRPVIKVIDFGVAKAVEERLNQQTFNTDLGRVVGTLGYMSPEQAGGERDIDTRSDIYSLGVVLYELLSGTKPFGEDRLREAAFDAVLRMIREEEPLKPSTKLGQLGESAAEVAAQRSTEIRRLARMLSGELDWIVMRSLEKDRDRRYETANAFALDVESFLGDEPVSVGPPALSYRFGKFLSRNRAILLVGSSVLVIGVTIGFAMHAAMAVSAVMLLMGTIFSGVVWRMYLSQRKLRRRAELERGNALEAKTEAKREAVRANQAREREAIQRERAEQKANEAKAVLKFFEEKVIAAARPAGQHGGLGISATIREALEAAERQIGERFAERPLVEASIRGTLGQNFMLLGEAKSAVRQLERALELQVSALGEHHVDTLGSMHNLSSSYEDVARFDEALELQEKVFRLSKGSLGSEHSFTLSTMNNLANLYVTFGRDQEALEIREQLYAVTRKGLDPDPFWDITGWMGNLAFSYFDAGRREEAQRLWEEQLALSRKINGPEHPDTLNAMDSLASSYHASGRNDEALAMRERILELQQNVLGAEHPDTLDSMCALAISFRDSDRLPEASDLLERALVLMHKKLPENHKFTLRALEALAGVHEKRGDHAAAEELYRKASASPKIRCQ